MSRQQSKKNKHYLRRSLVFVIVIVVVGGLFFLFLPTPKLDPIISPISITQKNVVLPWPGYGESAIGASGYGLIQSHGPSTMLPIASVAKIITVLTVLKRRPLSLNQQGPVITLGPTDVESYDHYSAIGGSVVLVANGEKLSEYQAIQAILLPSANNMADSLAIWAYGSLPAYVIAANQYLKSVGLSDTVVANDASGYLPGSKSTASDLVALGQLALSNPVIKQVVGQKQASVPVAGLINNVDWLLGTDGIVGIKTGNTDQAGGVYLFAVNFPVTSVQNVEIIGSVMGAPSLVQALNNSVPLIDAAKTNFQSFTLVTKGQIVGYYKLPWNNQLIDAQADSDLSTVAWTGSIPVPQVRLNKISAPLSVNSRVGTISINQQSSHESVHAVLGQPLKKSPWQWRLLRQKD